MSQTNILQIVHIFTIQYPCNTCRALDAYPVTFKVQSLNEGLDIGKVSYKYNGVLRYIQTERLMLVFCKRKERKAMAYK